jgi:hypothetical protein
MPPTPLAALFVFTEVMGTPQLEEYITIFWPHGLPAQHLRGVLGFPQIGVQLYHGRMVEMALRLLMAGHTRSPGQILQELGYIPLLAPLPPIQVSKSLCLGGLALYKRDLGFRLVCLRRRLLREMVACFREVFSNLVCFLYDTSCNSV